MAIEHPIYEDYFGHEVYRGDEILVVDNEIFLKYMLPDEAVGILKTFCHAIERRAGE